MNVFTDFSLQDEDGYLRQSNEFHPGLFVWLRQLGCRYARKQVAQLRKLEILPPVSLVLISPSAPPQARPLRRTYLKGLRCALLSDTQLKTFGNNRQEKPPFWSFLDQQLGDPLQNGRIQLTRSNGQIQYQFEAHKAGQQPNTAEFQRAVRMLRL
jgi:hypothetical protein